MHLKTLSTLSPVRRDCTRERTPSRAGARRVVTTVLPTVLLMLARAVVAQQPFAQDFVPSVTFTEDYVEVMEFDSEEGYYAIASDKLSPLKVIAKASTVGMDLNALNAATPFQIVVGDFKLSGVLGDDSSYTPGAASIRIPVLDEDWETGKTITVGQAVIAWADGAVTATLQVNRPDTYGQVAWWYAGTDEPIEETLATTFVLGDRTLKRNVFITGTSLTKIQRYGPGADDEVELYEVRTHGSSDVERPTVKLTSPKDGDILESESISITAKAEDNRGVAKVSARVNGATEFTPLTKNAAGTWTLANVPLTYGDNVIRLQSVDVEGNESLIAESIVKRWTAVTINVAGEGKVTQGFAGTTLREVGSSVTVVATPKPGSVFAGWSGSAETNSPSLTFTVAPGLSFTASFVPSPFVALKGRYDGLVMRDGAGVGSLKVKLTPAGTFTAKILLNGEAVRLAGSFDATGAFNGAVVAAGSVWTVNLQVDREEGADGISGTLSNGTETLTLGGSRSVYSAANPAPQKGYYTVAIPASAAAGTPQGNGYARISVTKNGMARVSGALPDATRFAFAAPLDKRGVVPVFVALYDGRGAIAGTLNLGNGALTAEVTGALHWRKDPNATADGFYPAGFECELEAFGSRYAGAAALNWMSSTAAPSGVVIRIGEGGLAELEQSGTVTGTPNRLRITSSGGAQVAIEISARTGVITGSFREPGWRKRRVVTGVLLQLRPLGVGVFRGGSSAGYVNISTE